MRNTTILVVEDEPRIVEIIERYLSLQGFGVKTAYNGKDALEILAQGAQVDLTVVDEKMPGMSGLSLIREIKKIRKDMPIIRLTGSISIAQLKRLSRKPDNSVLIKPIRLSELLSLVNKFLGRETERGSDPRKKNSSDRI
ncbi:MAG: response regulator [Candidatus Omnitrophota bacterium]